MNFHVMADIGTLGTGNDACPVVIGAVKFTEDLILDRFEVGIDPDDAQRYGRVITGGTVMWWFDPKRDMARERLWRMPKIDLFSALQGFSDWCRLPCSLEAQLDDVPLPETTIFNLGSLWGKGSTFDNIILRSAAQACQVEWPFSFRDDECFRTMARRFAHVPEPDFIGTPHVAVDDALHQARHLQLICKAAGIEL